MSNHQWIHVRTLAEDSSWSSWALQLSELLSLNRPVRTCALSDSYRVMELGERTLAFRH